MNSTKTKKNNDVVIPIRECRNPRFKKLIKNNKSCFPNNLLFGFELETIVPDKSIRYNGYRKGILLNHRYEDLKGVFYAKTDGSVEGGYNSCGLEINSHPFNWNWFLGHKKHFYNLAKFLEESKSSCNRTCGFHVHINKDYFKDIKHRDRFLFMFYKNPEQVYKISKRPRKSDLSDNATPWAFTNYGRLSIKDVSIHFNGDYNDEKYLAANIYHKETIEIRIFQSTINPLLFTSYLEYCMALAIYTKNGLNILKMDKFIKYVKANRKMYPNLFSSKLLEKPKTISYKSSLSSIKRNRFWKI